jgi:hypothetical protein
MISSRLNLFGGDVTVEPVSSFFADIHDAALAPPLWMSNGPEELQADRASIKEQLPAIEERFDSPRRYLSRSARSIWSCIGLRM